ncbi:DUF5130 family protein [[Mycobacterium] crassicus]|uniref:DUF5130 family protein n=1 Tax=[Mycobacterium] crassicus TaxID=2872309 RepID=A0ABU5XEL8_9MYCO|nr:DUF5130 family protein [Mycolicibacter sp. MYC098]MEB3020623.1 DUF5130 family protein [Mycolicibacter sp. MYC098]
MATGDVATIDPADLPYGSAITYSGRISGVVEPGEVPLQYPFPTRDLVALDNALTDESRASKARFATYIGDLGADTAARAGEILAKVPTPNDAVLIAVSPDQRAIEIVYGAGVGARIAPAAAPQAVAAAAAAFSDGSLIDGLIAAVRLLSAGISRP